MCANEILYGMCKPHIISPGHLWCEVEQNATEGIFAFLNLVLYGEWQKKIPRRKKSDDRFIVFFQNGAQSRYLYIYFIE